MTSYLTEAREHLAEEIALLCLYHYTPVETNPLYSLLKQPNPLLSYVEFRDLLRSDFYKLGRCVVVLLLNAQKTQVEQLHPIDAARCAILTTDKKQMDKYPEGYVVVRSQGQEPNLLVDYRNVIVLDKDYLEEHFNADL